MNNLLLILASLCAAELVHNAIEIWGMCQKVNWLSLTQNGEEHGRWPININSKLRVVVLHFFILVFFGGGNYFILKTLRLSDRHLVIGGIIILLANYVLTTGFVDIYHNQIGKLINKAKKQI